jgi:predicted amidohydrolase
MFKDLKGAVVQAKVPKDKGEGEYQVRRLVKEAASMSVDIVGLPEDCIASYEEVNGGYEALPFLSSIAKENSVYLFGASGVKEDDGVHNRGFLFDKVGNLIGTHDKMILTPLEITVGIVPGKALEVFDTEFGRVAILVCFESFYRYSAWFFNELKKAGVEIILIPSYSLNMSERSIGNWVDSLHALAKWFEIYILAPGTIGQNVTPYPSFGHALIISPKRGILKEGSFDKEEILIDTLDVNSLEEIKRITDFDGETPEIPQVSLIK